MNDRDPLGLYLHIPFCQAICAYCNFNRGLIDADVKRRYVAALEREIIEAGDGAAADTIFFGGGTPSLLQPDEVARLITAGRRAYAVSADTEITLETNPETVTESGMARFLDAGINRVSLGAQTFDDEQLRRLGRIHTADRIGEAVAAVRAAGVRNVSLDLMFWLPGQSRESWMRSVERAIALEPDHLSLYLLELYPNAPLRETMARAGASGDGKVAAPAPQDISKWIQASDDEAADMYLEAFERLETAGYGQYEISNVAREGRASRHNLKYWTGGRWRGFGCGAHSTVDGHRWQNLAGTVDYIDKVESGQPVAVNEQQLSAKTRAEEALFTGLRLTAGIDCALFEARHGFDPWRSYEAALEIPLTEGLVWRDASTFGLTRRGMLIANEILAMFV